MKNFMSVVAALFLFTTAGCQREATVQEVMNTEERRKEVYAMIMDNPEMRQEMMQTMRQHPEGGMMMGRGRMMSEDTTGMMMGDTAMMGGMNREKMHQMVQQMMAACAQDSANCSMMSRMIMNHRQMMQGMMRQMRQRGMMDEACYQQMRRRINP
ncbi:hypothetical protein [Pontibacter russatus]|uniref:hypothetical protein n=1 Tax=Pontibacter russatus TaxID=2694929 RepID=UPI00137B6CD4|nr:hypothetical protein [Pontibacter russatus]